MNCGCLQENVVRDFELNELHLQCKKTPLTKHRDKKDVINNHTATAAAADAAAAAATTEPAAEANEDLVNDVDADVKKTQ